MSRDVSTGKTILFGIAAGIMLFTTITHANDSREHPLPFLYGMSFGVFALIFWDRFVKKGKGGV